MSAAPVLASHPGSPLRTLPFARWASRLHRGEVRLRGRLDAPLGPFQPGPLDARFEFLGAPEPHITGLVVGGLVIEPAKATRALAELVDGLHDFSFDAVVEPDGDLLVRLALGVEVMIPSGTHLHVEGAACGTPAEPRLDRPLVLRFDGEGLRLSHEVRWVARFAEIRLARAELRPDGTVALDARATSRAGDLALRMPLRRAAVHLTEIVRRSPKVGRFLR